MENSSRPTALDRLVVTVIIPTHNRAHCLPHAVDSVYAQEGRGKDFQIELIVVDDGSSDATRDVVHQYEGLRYVRLPERRGVSAALNAGLRASTGDYVTFLGDDDVFLPHKLRVQLPALRQRPDVGVVYSQTLMRLGTKETEYPDSATAPSGSVFGEMLMHNFCGHHASLLIRRTVFDTIGEFDTSLASHEDYDLSLRMAFHVPFLFVPGAVDVYNVSPQGLWLTGAAHGLGLQDAERVIEKALQRLPDSGRFAKVKALARGHVALFAAAPFVLVGDHARAWATATKGLRTHPSVLCSPRARSFLQWVACERARGAASPLAMTLDSCGEIKSATRTRAVVAHWYVRQTIAAIFWEMASFLAAGDRRRKRAAARAAAYAVAQAPWYLPRMSVLRLILGGILA